MINERYEWRNPIGPSPKWARRHHRWFSVVFIGMLMTGCGSSGTDQATGATTSVGGATGSVRPSTATTTPLTTVESEPSSSVQPSPPPTSTPTSVAVVPKSGTVLPFPIADICERIDGTAIAAWSGTTEPAQAFSDDEDKHSSCEWTAGMLVQVYDGDIPSRWNTQLSGPGTHTHGEVDGYESLDFGCSANNGGGMSCGGLVRVGTSVIRINLPLTDPSRFSEFDALAERIVASLVQ